MPIECHAMPWLHADAARMRHARLAVRFLQSDPAMVSDDTLSTCHTLRRPPQLRIIDLPSPCRRGWSRTTAQYLPHECLPPATWPYFPLVMQTCKTCKSWTGRGDAETSCGKVAGPLRKLRFARSASPRLVRVLPATCFRVTASCPRFARKLSATCFRTTAYCPQLVRNLSATCPQLIRNLSATCKTQIPAVNSPPHGPPA